MLNATYSTQEEFQGPILQFSNESKLWRLVVDYVQEWGPLDFRKRLFMAAGYEYNKASVPRFLRGIARHDEVWEGPTIWHDRFYEEQGRFPHPDLFRFETKINGIWRPDLTRWRRGWADDFLEMDGIFAGASPWEAAEYKWTVKLYPPNWFKGF